MEVVALVFDQKRTLIIHAMPVRKATLALLEGSGRVEGSGRASAHRGEASGRNRDSTAGP